MRMRGKAFWVWAELTFPYSTHDETLADGTSIDVQARLSKTGGTQLFIGVYALSGQALQEVAFDSLPGETVSRALAWGVDQARQTASDHAASLLLADGYQDP